MATSDGADVDRRNELAEIRTEAAHLRTQLANERTFSAWIRTGLALLVAGFAVTNLLQAAGPSWLLTAVGLVLIALGALAFGLGYWSYRTTAGARLGTMSRLMALIAIVLVLLSGIAAYLILSAVAPA